VPRDRGLPPAKTMLGDQGYDPVWFRSALIARGITPCTPSKRNRKMALPYDRTLDRECHRIENVFGKLTDPRRIHTRWGRCAHTLFSAIVIAATFIF
jgi:hypothetical protein